MSTVQRLRNAVSRIGGLFPARSSNRPAGRPVLFLVVLAAVGITVAACESVIIQVIPVQTVQILPSAAQIDAGNSVSLQLRIEDSQGRALGNREVSWSSNLTSVATVDGAGLVQGVSEGVATITASVEGRQATSVITVRGLPRIGVSAQVVNLSVVAGAADTDQAQVVVTNAGGATLGGLTVGVRYEGVTAGWLTASLRGAIAPTVLDLSASSAGLAAGSYRAFVDVASPDDSNSPVTVTVNLEVLAVNPAPTLTSVNPFAGVRGATLDVQVTGSGFVPSATAVSFGQGVTVLETSVTSPNALTARVRIEETAVVGPRDVQVTNPAPGGGIAILAGAFGVAETGNPAPTLAAVDPAEGTRGQTLDVTLTGTGFVDGVTAVSFGNGISVDQLVFVGSTSITATVAVTAGAGVGPRNVTVTNPAPGGGTATLPEGFLVVQEDYPQPVLTGAAPVSGARGTTLGVVLGGSGFVAGVTTVSFGAGVTVNTVTVESPTRINVQITIATGAAVGSRNVTATNPAPGGGTGTLIAGFEVTAAADRPMPVITGIAPDEAPRGTTVDIALTGDGFVSGVTTVSFGPGVSVVLTVDSPTSATARATIQADAVIGLRDVVVTNPAPGGGVATLEDGFEITMGADNPSPVLSSIDPSSGARGTTMSVTLTGTGFVDGATTVSFGDGIAVVAVDVNSSTSILATITLAGGAALGARDVTVTNPAPGGGTSTLVGGFTVTEPGNPAPTLTSVAPGTGSQGQTLQVVLTGSGYFGGITTVSFGAGITIDQVTVTSFSSITVTITINGAAALGARDVTVTNPAPGGGSATLAGGFVVSAE